MIEYDIYHLIYIYNKINIKMAIDKYVLRTEFKPYM
jgi:hypothetical protein